MSEAEQLDLHGVAAQASEPRETILVVDDDPGVLSMASDILRAVGYRVFSTGDPSEALRLAGSSADRIHLLLTDIVMPLMNGGDLAKQLRAWAKRGDVFAYFISGAKVRNLRIVFSVVIGFLAIEMIYNGFAGTTVTGSAPGTFFS